MPLFLVERNFAEDLELGADDVLGITAVNDDVGVRWVYSFLSADKRKTYCLYEAPTEEAIREAARRNGIPADAIVPVGEIHPEAIVAGEATA
jgi:Nickel responsive protein SCO4226-like